MNSKTILIADDEPFMRTMLTVVLEKGGFAVRTAGDGVEALDRVRDTLPHLLFVDAMMPRVDGFEVCAAVRRDTTLSRQPHIIMLSGMDQESDRARAFAAGADEYLSKPFSPAHLLARAAEVCR
jgi:two-component system, OmpR family, alkaline phosphatase synthesis response regulator PhoP